MTQTDDFYAEPAEMSGPAEPTGRYGRYILPTGPGKAKEHTSPSTLGKSLEDGFGLGVWRSKRIAWAIATRPDLALKLSSIPLADLDKSEDAKEVMRAAEHIGATDEGANMGTAIHNVLQRVDQGEPRDSFHPYFHQVVDNYLATLAAAKLTVIPELIERVVLCDRYGCAGKFDNIMAEDDGTLVVVDKKSEADPTDGPQSICTQLGLYANSDRMMNYQTGQYEAMPQVRKDYAIVIHIDRDTFEVKVHRFDIERGWASARLAWEKREWNKAKHLCHPYITNGQWVPQGPSGMAPQANGSHEQRPAAVQELAAQIRDAGAPLTFDERLDFVRQSATDVMAAKPDVGASPTPNGQATPRQAADAVNEAANAVIDAAHGRTKANPAPYPVYETPAPIEQPTVQDQLARAEAAPAVEPATRVDEIMAVRKNDKGRLQVWARSLGCTDLAHHRKWLAEWIVKATPGSGAVEPSGEADSGPSDRHPQTMAEAGFAGIPVPQSPPGVPVVGPGSPTYRPEPPTQQPDAGNDFTKAAIVQEIVTAPDMDRIMSIWQRVVGALGQGGWSGEIKAAADARVAVLRAPVQPAGQGGLPY